MLIVFIEMGFAGRCLATLRLQQIRLPGW